MFSELAKKGMNEEKTKRVLKTLNHERLVEFLLQNGSGMNSYKGGKWRYENG